MEGKEGILYICRHPGLVVINGCPEEKRICCASCNTICEAACVAAPCAHAETVMKEGNL